MIVVKLGAQTTPEQYVNEQIQQMQYMTGVENVKRQKITISGGLEGTKALVKVKTPIGNMCFFAIWIVSNNTGYSLFFHAEASKFSVYQPKVIEMIKSFKLSKVPAKTVELVPHISKESNYIMRYPKDFNKKSRGMIIK